MLSRIALALLRRLVADRRRPDQFIGGERDPYIRRWKLSRKRLAFNLYLHQILRDDADVMHDHPWSNASWVLSGGYFEHLPLPEDQARFERDGTPAMPARVIWRAAGRLVIRPRGELAHRLTLPRDAEGRPVPCWSLFLIGPNRRSWGFHCPRGWVWWRDYTKGETGELIGLGCDQGDDYYAPAGGDHVQAAREGGA
jgi:hypothetical protein